MALEQEPGIVLLPRGLPLAEAERMKAYETLPEMIRWLKEHPQRFSPLFQRWLGLAMEHDTMVYLVKPPDPFGRSVLIPRRLSPGERLKYGKQNHIVEILEEAVLVSGAKGTYFAKVVGEA